MQFPEFSLEPEEEASTRFPLNRINMDDGGGVDLVLRQVSRLPNILFRELDSVLIRNFQIILGQVDVTIAIDMCNTIISGIFLVVSSKFYLKCHFSDTFLLLPYFNG